MAQGIDIHPYYQRGIDWTQVANESDIEFVWVKVSDGGGAYSKNVGGVTYVPDGHIYGARARGLKVGGYHYAEFSPQPQQQANVLTTEVLRLSALDLPPALDLEAPFVPGASAEAFAYLFLTHLKKNGFGKVALYAGPAMMQSVASQRVLAISGLVIWIAGEYPHPRYYKGQADVHQYTASGRIPGIPQEVDLDRSLTPFLSGDDMVGITEETPSYIDLVHRVAELHALILDMQVSHGRIEALLNNTDVVNPPGRPQEVNKLAAELGALVGKLEALVGQGITFRSDGQITVRAE